MCFICFPGLFQFALLLVPLPVQSGSGNEVRVQRVELRGDGCGRLVGRVRLLFLAAGRLERASAPQPEDLAVGLAEADQVVRFARDVQPVADDQGPR